MENIQSNNATSIDTQKLNKVKGGIDDNVIPMSDTNKKQSDNRQINSQIDYLQNHKIRYNGLKGGESDMDLQKYIDRLDQDRRDMETRLREDRQAAETRQEDRILQMETRLREDRQAAETRQEDRMQQMETRLCEDRQAMETRLREDAQAMENRFKNLFNEHKRDIQWTIAIFMTLVGIALAIIQIIF